MHIWLFAFLVLCGGANAQQASWIVLGNGAITSGAREAIVDLASNSERTTAVRIRFTSNRASLSKVAVTYSNGQVHYETQDSSSPAALQIDEIDARLEPRVVNSVTVVATAVETAVSFEILGRHPGADSRARAVATTGGSQWTAVPVFYGTTRNSEAPRRKGQSTLASYGVSFGSDLAVGRAVVTVPVERETGTIPRPSWVRLIFGKEDPATDFVLVGVEPLGADTFQTEIGKHAASARRFAGQAFIFVHGFNVSFDDGLFRAAQIAHDIGFDGTTVLYSWPSRGSAFGYRYDVDAVKLGRAGLLKLMNMLGRTPEIKKVNVIAHSLGNDVLVEVLSQLGGRGPQDRTTQSLKLNEVIFASPDVAQPVFVQLADTFRGIGKARTVYASNTDKALQISSVVRTGVPRAGDVPQAGPVIVAGTETIDVSEADLGLFSLNHSTFAERRHIVEDLRLLFTKGVHPPSERFPVYKQRGTGSSAWWAYVRN